MKSKVFEKKKLEKTLEDIKAKNVSNCENSKSFYLIEKGIIDPMENRNADWYEPYGFKLTEQEAKEFCDSQGYWSEKDCWSIAYHPDKIMPKYRYKEIKLI